MATKTSVVMNEPQAPQATADIRLDLTGVLSEEIGPTNGLTQGDWLAIRSDLDRVAEEIRGLRRDGHLGPLDLPYRREELADVHRLATECRSFRNFVILGIGGSALGPRAVYEGCLPLYYNLLSDLERGGPRVFVAENIDPDSFASLLDVAPPGETVYNVISKSGTTIETLSQFLVIWELLRSALGQDARNHLIVTTDPAKGFLRDLAVSAELRSLPVPQNVGGRYSVLSAVGLLPAAVAGISPEDLLAGAARMDERCRSRSYKENPALALAATHILMDRAKGKTSTVMMPYSDGLRSFSEWFCQLWAESLGKRRTPSGESRAPVGQTPIRAVGATDQHSQLQLYVDGPNDKLFTLIAVGQAGRDVRVPLAYPPELSAARLEHIAGHAVGEILAIERNATELALLAAQRPVMVLDVPCLSAHVMGQMFYLYEWATIAAGMLYHVDPFDQPGVEEGKRLTHAAMGRPGLEEDGERVRMHISRTDRYRI
jgi:glucose-6-phosphate isomerase